MIIKPDTKMKIEKFFKKYSRVIIIVLAVWFAVILVNTALKNTKNYTPETTYEPQIAVLDSSSSAPKKIHEETEDFVEKYVGYCNSGEYEKAYDMISDDCKEEYFGNYQAFVSFVKNKFTQKKIYMIQDYSNYNGKYIYNLRLYDDILATGLTGSTYSFLEEKLIVTYDEDKNVKFNVGGFIGSEKVQSVQENEYLKADILSKSVFYEYEIYKIKFTNRSDKTIVISNGQVPREIAMNVSGELRAAENSNIILRPNEDDVAIMLFPKFFDDKASSNSILLDSIRVVDEYIEENPNEDNAIYKFSMELGL